MHERWFSDEQERYSVPETSQSAEFLCRRSGPPRPLQRLPGVLVFLLGPAHLRTFALYNLTHPLLLGHIAVLRIDATYCYTDGVAWSLCRSVGDSREHCEQPIKMPSGMWTRVGPRKHVLDGGLIGTTWRIRLNRPCAAAIRPYVKIL